MTRTLLRRGLAALGGAFAASSTARAQGGGAMTRIDFEAAATGALPPGVTTALTGSGGPVAWTVLEDPMAPAGPRPGNTPTKVPSSTPTKPYPKLSGEAAVRMP